MALTPKKMMLKFIHVLFSYILILSLGTSCRTIHRTESIPADTYYITYTDPVNAREVRIKADVEQSDSILTVSPVSDRFKPYVIDLKKDVKIRMFRNTLDIDVLTVPFKVRPPLADFPEQLNANFNGALYFGRRRDSYTIEANKTTKMLNQRITGVGYGYGGFIGLGSTNMNTYVTRKAIDYEYDGFVLNSGIAGIYDAKKFNLGIAIGADFLIDKNRQYWIYQGKPWIGLLFGINLN